MKSIIVGISGKKRVGKNTVSRMLCDIAKTKGYTTHELAFADAVKEEVSKACGLPIEFMERQKDVFRPIYQWWGTDFRRQFFGRDYWALQLSVKISHLPKDDQFITVTDVRFPNEADCIALHFKSPLLRISRPGIPTDNHKSETALDDYKFDHTIINDGDRAELQMKVSAWWRETFEREPLPPEITAMNLL